MADVELPSIDDIEAAHARIAPHVHRTPIVTCRTLDEMVGARVHLKCENFQRAGAFKARGATNAVMLLDEAEAGRGVAAHSSGNHAAALALAASMRDIPAYVVMPANAPRVKVAATRHYGAQVVECAPSLEARASKLAEVLADTGAHEIHPYDDVRVIAGAATACLELLDDRPEVSVVLAPVSGGGLLSGTAIVAQSRRVDAWGVEPSGADDAYRSLLGGRLIRAEGRTIADGLLANLSPRTFAALSQRAAGIVTVTDDEIQEAMRFLFERTKLVVEASGATALAGLLRLPDKLSGDGALPDDVGVILSGGNVDLDDLPFKPLS